MALTLQPRIAKLILSLTGAKSLESGKLLQELWSGYGGIFRVRLMGSPHQSVIVKHICPSRNNKHPRGWDTDRSHLRKVKSYEVETAFYQNWSHHCDQSCRVPKLLSFDENDTGTLLILEDLDAAGYPARDLPRVTSGLRWLAHFHATFLGKTPADLWEIGTYWNLATRPDEWNALEPGPIKDAAKEIDDRLSQATYQTFVHGDAKLANFCFSPSGDRIAAVDFQYVGGGCGMKDVAYFIGSCLRESECEEQEEPLLNLYFNELRRALSEKHLKLDAEAVVTEWRALYPIAWTDFHRFLKGWSPGHWKLNSYSERLARDTLESLRREVPPGK